MFKKIRSYFIRGWSIKLPSAKASYMLLLKKLERNERVSLSRWGDGEWEAVLDLRSENDANCDGHQYFDSLKSTLQNILISNPKYIFGMQRLAYHKVMGRKIDNFLRLHKIKREWINADAFHYASEHGMLDPFLDILKHKKVLLIGPAHLKSLDVFSFDFIEIPAKNCWLERDRILENISAKLKSQEYDFLIFCAGMTANFFVDHLYGHVKASLLDMGSVFDPYTGKNSRRYHDKLKIAGKVKSQ